MKTLKTTLLRWLFCLLFYSWVTYGFVHKIKMSNEKPNKSYSEWAITTLRHEELTQVTEICKRLNHNEYSYASFCSLFAAFATVCSTCPGCYTSLCSKPGISTCRFLAISPSIVVQVLSCNCGQNIMEDDTKVKECLLFLNGTQCFAGKEAPGHLCCDISHHDVSTTSSVCLWLTQN